MSWLVRMLAKASRVDMTEVMNQQTADDVIHIIKELLL
ncbi:hypothetical protein J2X61_004873 [Bacillus sp. 3255]|nr:hypothetical protein [Bacillus sp. 3255]